ncbi:MAG: hypothetical protein WBF71_13225 [Microthrixaceae bacterium]
MRVPVERVRVGGVIKGSSDEDNTDRRSDHASSRPSSLVLLFIAAVAPLLALTPMLMQRKVIPQDEGQLLTYPSLMLRGLQANTDFVYTYGISNLWALRITFQAFGESVLVERSLGLAVRLVLILVVTDMVRRSAGPKTALLAGWTCALVLASEGLQSFAWISALTVGLLAVWLAANMPGDRRKLAIALPWFLAGAAISFRVDIAIAVVVAVGLAQWCRSLKLLPAWAASGFLLGLAPLWIQMLTADNVLSDSIIDPILNGGGRRLPLVPHDRTLAFSILLLLVALGVVCSVLWINRSHRFTAGYVNMLGLGTLAVLVFPQVVQRVDLTHFSYVAPVLLPAAIAASVLGLETIDRSKLRSPIPMTGLVLVAVTTLAAIGFGLVPLLRPTAVQARGAYTGRADQLSTEVGVDGRTVPFDPSQATELRALLRTTASLFDPRKCERLFVGPSDLRFARYSDTFIYFILERFKPATRYLEFNPGGANAKNSKLADELKSADVVILNSDWDDPASLGQPSGAAPNEAGPAKPNEVIERDFTTAASFGPWRLLLGANCRAPG